jgi:oligo-1,6-glucosidase
LTGLAKISRDNARTPMQWDSAAHAGFTTGEPWLPVNPNHTWLNAAAQQDATDSVFAHYRQLIQLRHERPILIDGDFTPLFDDDPHIWAYTRVNDTESLLIIANCGTDPRSVTVDDSWLGAGLVLANSPAPESIDSHTIPLDSWDARIYHKPA